MDNLMRQIQLRMELLGKNEVRFACSNNGKDKMELIDATIEALQRHKQNLIENPEDFEEKDPNARFKIEVELLKIND